jgi:hypothetical protein
MIGSNVTGSLHRNPPTNHPAKIFPQGQARDVPIGAMVRLSARHGRTKCLYPARTETENAMKILRVFLYPVIAILALPLLAGDFTPYVAESTADSVRVRSGPSLAHPPVHVLAEGESLVVVGEKDGWAIVRLPAKAPCWIAADFVEVKGDKAIVTGDRVNLRIEPATRHFPVGQATKGQELRLVIDDDGNPVATEDFVRVVPPKQATGAVSTDFLSRVGAYEPTPEPEVKTEPAAEPAIEGSEPEPAKPLVEEPEVKREPTAAELKDEKETFAELERLLADELKKPAAEIRLVNIRNMFEQFEEIALSDEIRNRATDYIKRIDATVALIETELARVEREAENRRAELERIRAEAAKAGKQETKEEATGPVEYIAIGTVGSHGRTARTPASHRLFDDEGNVVFDLRWDNGALSRFMGSRVGIVGEIKEYEGWPHKVIVITRIEVIDDGEEK